MGFFSLQEINKTMTIKNKKRINKIVPYKNNEIIIFYQDCTYQHYELFQNKIIHEGKLEFSVTKVIEPQFQQNKSTNKKMFNNKKERQYICLIEQKQNKTIFGILNISSQLYQPYESVFFTKTEDFQSVNYHLISSGSSKYPLLIQITLNVENGIMIRCFDFKRKYWLDDILYLGSKFLNYFLIHVPLSLTQINQKSKNHFCLLGNGQKSQSLHIVCIQIQEKLEYAVHNQFSPQSSILSIVSESQQVSTISHQQQQKQLSTMKFTFTKQIKYFRNFTMLGGLILKEGYLFLIGNSLFFDTKQKKSMSRQPTCLNLNFLSFYSNIQSQAIFKSLQNFRIGRQIIVRQYIGQIDNDMIFIVENSIKKSLHKLSPLKILNGQQIFDEQIYTFENYSPSLKYQLSHDQNCLLSYQLICQQFFEKIKDSPSVVKINILMKVGKKVYYKQMLEKLLGENGKNQEALVMAVLQCF